VFQTNKTPILNQYGNVVHQMMNSKNEVQVY